MERTSVDKDIRLGSTSPTSVVAREETRGPDTSTTPSNISTFHSLQFRNFRLLWFGNMSATAGQWIQMATLSWLVYDMTGSGTLLGGINAMRSIPMLLLGPLAGVAADRLNRRTLMLTSQLSIFVLAFGFGLDLALGYVAVWHLFAFSFLAGTAQVLNMPVRQTIVFDVVPREAIPNAVALSTAAFNVTRIIGPSAAGFLIAWFGPEGNFFIQSVAYLGVVVSVLMMQFPSGKRDERKQSLGKNLLDGVRYIIKEPTTRLLITIGAIPPLLVMPAFFALLPVFAKDVFHSGPEGLGLLMSSMGVGGLLGALFTASLGGFDRRGLLQLAALFTMSLSLLGLGLSPSLYVALPVLAIGGFCEMVYMTTNQTILQLSVPSEMRGRITSIFMLNMGLMPLGSLVLGIAADVVGAPTAVTVSGIAVVSLTALVALLSSRLRSLRLSELNTDGSTPRTSMPVSTG